MRYIGWVLFGWGILGFLFHIGYLIYCLVLHHKEKYNIDLKERFIPNSLSDNIKIYGIQLISIFTIGVGSYIIKNFP